jgi:hypothetical protein
VINPIGLDRRRSDLLELSLLCIGLAVVLVVVNAIDLPEHVLGFTFEINAAGLGIWLAILIVWWARKRGKLDPFELPVWFSLNAYGQAVLPNWLLRRNLIIGIPSLRANPGPKMVEAVWLFGFGLTCLWLGYVWTSRWLEKHPPRTQPVAGSIRAKVVLAVWFASWLLSIVSVVAGYNTYLGSRLTFVWTNYLAFIQLIGWAAWSALLLHHFRQPTGLGWIWMTIALGSDVWLGLVSGTKKPVLTFFWLLMHTYYVRGKLSWRWMAFGLAGAILIIPSVNYIREDLHTVNTLGAGVEFENRLQIVSEAVQEAVHRPLTALTNETTDTVLKRQGELLQITASVLALHPGSMPFLGLDMLWDFFQQLIPRLVWTNKPVGLSALDDITGVYYGLPSTRSAIGQFADSYRAGGWPFVALWFIGIGSLSAWIYRQGPGNGNIPWMVFYFLILSNIVTYDISLKTLLLRLIQMGPLVWIAITHMLYRPLPRSRSNEAVD